MFIGAFLYRPLSKQAGLFLLFTVAMGMGSFELVRPEMWIFFGLLTNNKFPGVIINTPSYDFGGLPSSLNQTPNVVLAEYLNEVNHSLTGNFRLLIAIVLTTIRDDLHERVRDCLIECFSISYGGAAVLVAHEYQSGACDLAGASANGLSVLVCLQHFQI